MPDLQLGLGVLKHRAPLARGADLPAKIKLRWILLMWCNIKFEGVLIFPGHALLTSTGPHLS